MRADGTLPDLVVSLGSAGSRRLEQTEVYQAVSVAYRDMDASPFGFEKGVTPFLDLPATVAAAAPHSRRQEATLSTGASVISGAAYDAIAADMVDMETFAVPARLPGIRRAADRPARHFRRRRPMLEHVGDWTEYLHVVDEKLADAVRRLEAAIGDGLLAERHRRPQALREQARLDQFAAA